jgi:hypothetical protein
MYGETQNILKSRTHTFSVSEAILLIIAYEYTGCFLFERTRMQGGYDRHACHGHTYDDDPAKSHVAARRGRGHMWDMQRVKGHYTGATPYAHRGTSQGNVDMAMAGWQALNVRQLDPDSQHGIKLFLMRQVVTGAGRQDASLLSDAIKVHTRTHT